jgi:hypothetical protein
MSQEKKHELLWQLSDGYFKLKNPLCVCNQYKFLKTKEIVLINFGRYIVAIKLKNVFRGKIIYKFMIRADHFAQEKSPKTNISADLKFKNTSYLKLMLKGLDYNKKIKKSKQKSNQNTLSELINVFKIKKHIIENSDFEVMLRHENLIRGKTFFEKIKIFETENCFYIVCKLSSNSLWLVCYRYSTKLMSQIVLDKRILDLIKNDKATITDFTIVKAFSDDESFRFGILFNNYPQKTFSFHIFNYSIAFDKLSATSFHHFDHSVSPIRFICGSSNLFSFYLMDKIIRLKLTRKEINEKSNKYEKSVSFKSFVQPLLNFSLQYSELQLNVLFIKEGILFAKPFKTYHLRESIVFVYPQHVSLYCFSTKTLKVIFKLPDSFVKFSKKFQNHFYLADDSSIYALDSNSLQVTRISLNEDQSIDGFTFSENGLLLIVFSQNSKTYDKKADILIFKNKIELIDPDLLFKNPIETMLYYINDFRDMNLLDNIDTKIIKTAGSKRIQNKLVWESMINASTKRPVDIHRFLYNLAYYKSNKFVIERERLLFLKLYCPENSGLFDLLSNRETRCAHEGCNKSISNIEIKGLYSKCKDAHTNIYTADTGNARIVWSSLIRFCEQCHLYFEKVCVCALCSSILI